MAMGTNNGLFPQTSAMVAPPVAKAGDPKNPAKLPIRVISSQRHSPSRTQTRTRTHNRVTKTVPIFLANAVPIVNSTKTANVPR
jgi:hypothetical protein